MKQYKFQSNFGIQENQQIQQISLAFEDKNPHESKLPWGRFIAEFFSFSSTTMTISPMIKWREEKQQSKISVCHDFFFNANK